jgi:hypothetical protein
MTTETTAKPRARRAKQPDVLTQQNMELMPMSQNDMRAPDPAPVVMSSGPMRLLEIAVNRGASVEEMAQLIALRERVEADEARKAYVVAMAAFKRNPPVIVKNKTATITPRDGGKPYSYEFANLAAVVTAITESLAAQGISHDWTTSQQGQAVTVTCTLTHEFGHSKSTTLTANADTSGGKNAIQAVGSAVSYLERYTLLAACGIAVEDGGDNDGGNVTPAERQELQGAARNLRQSASQVVEGKQKDAKPAPAKLLEEARAAADKGPAVFGPYWRGLSQDQRTALGAELTDLQRRASHQDGIK